MSTGGGAGAFGRPPPSHHPPIRDASTLKYVLYGPGHEKYPSWPMPAATEVPVAIKVPPTGGSQRSKSWTDHTNYPKEQIIPYTRPYMKRSNSSQPQQLKTVLERCEKKNFDSIQYLHNMDHRKSNSSNDFNNPSPPERDQQKRDVTKMIYKTYSKESITPLTQADLEEYTKKFDETTLIQHQKQSSYAQSEGYHSYVSSSDSSSTPFIDSLKRDIDASVLSMSHVSSWDGESTVTTRPGSVSSSETLKWHGSLSDMSDVSNSSGTSPRQLIVHSARVQTPQKQNSESVLYMPRSSILTDRPLQRAPFSSTLSSQRSNHLNSQVFPSPVAPRKTVAECINIYEGKNIKAIQKKALMSYYERHQDQSKKDVRQHIINNPHPQNATSHMNIHRQNSMDSPVMKKPLQQLETNNSKCPMSSAIDSPNSIFQGPVIMGPSISLDEWVPERPPKNRQLLMPLSPDASLKPQRLTRPSMPMLSPSVHPADSDILFKYDDPFIASPEQEKELRQLSQRMSFDNFSQSGEPQSNVTSPDKILGRKPPEMPPQGYSKTLDSNRKCINPYIKSTSMKYDSVHKIDQSNAKFNLQSGCDYHQNNIHARSEVPVNKRLHSNKSFIEKSGQFRAEPLDRKRELADRELKKTLHPLEVKKYVQNKFNLDSFNKSYEISGQYRAEPLNLHPERHVSYAPMDSNRKLPPNKFNSAPPPVGPKIFRSKSESNHMTNMRNISYQANNCNSNFSKPIAPNQSIQRIFQNTETSNMSATQKLFGSKDSLSSKDIRTNKPYVEEVITDFVSLSCNNVPEKETSENLPIRDDRPPLPEKKKNLIPRNEEIKPVKTVDIPLHIDTIENEPLDVQPEFSNPIPDKSVDSVEPMNTDLTTPLSETHSENVEAQHVEPLQQKPIDIDQNEPSNAQFEKIKKLQTRPLLPEEIHWNKLWPVLLHSLPDSHCIRIIMSELEEYNNTALDIINIFVDDVDAPTSEDISTNSTDPHHTMNNDKENIAETDENTDLIELSLKHSLNFISDKNKIEEYVDLLIAALQNQEESLEKMMKTNDETAGTIVGALKEPHSTRLNRLMTDMGLVTSLICGLMSRYNRLKKSIKDKSPEQKENKLETEMARLTEKLEDAKALKIHIDSRKTKLLPILQSELKDLTQSFDHFMSTKIRLIIHMRDIKDRLDIVKKLKTALNQEKPCLV